MRASGFIRNFGSTGATQALPPFASKSPATANQHKSATEWILGPISSLSRVHARNLAKPGIRMRSGRMVGMCDFLFRPAPYIAKAVGSLCSWPPLRILTIISSRIKGIASQLQIQTIRLLYCLVSRSLSTRFLLPPDMTRYWYPWSNRIQPQKPSAVIHRVCPHRLSNGHSFYNPCIAS